MAEVVKPSEHEIKIGPGILKQVAKNRGHPLDVIREALSNSCAKEVEASFFKISIFYDAEYGWSFIFEDDGIGMDYTGEEEQEKQGRLDKFLNLAYGGVSGISSDEFGFKGLGSKLMYLCKKLEIETKTKEQDSHKVEVRNPYGKLIEQRKPELPTPVIYEDFPPDFERGTKIRVYGYEGGIKQPEYGDIDELKRYLRFRTIVGCTKPERLREDFPEIMVNTPDVKEPEKLEVGFPWIKKEGDHVEGQKIGTVEPPIEITEKGGQGNQVRVVLKGGYALRTGEFGLKPRTVHSKGVGLTYSWRGIPYFNLDFNAYKPKGFELYYKFCRFVVECNDVNTDMARGRIESDEKKKLFDKAVKKAYREVMDTDDYKKWVEHRRKMKKKDLGESLNERKAKLQSRDTKWVYYKGELLHREPDSEQDVRALLWKLEALKALPFNSFKTLEHTAQKGIDIIADFQEKDISENKLFQAVEVENVLESYSDHDHVPEQTSLIIAWDSRNRDDLTKVNNSEWRYVWDYAGHKLDVVLLKHLPDIEIKERN